MGGAGKGKVPAKGRSTTGRCEYCQNSRFKSMHFYTADYFFSCERETIAFTFGK
jgi:hypothetical protein